MKHRMRGALLGLAVGDALGAAIAVMASFLIWHTFVTSTNVSGLNEHKSGW